jgi:hypothetical protein
MATVGAFGEQEMLVRESGSQRITPATLKFPPISESSPRFPGDFSTCLH